MNAQPALSRLLPLIVAAGSGCFYLRHGPSGRYVVKTCGDSAEDEQTARQIAEALNASAAAPVASHSAISAVGSAIAWIEENAEELEAAGIEWQSILSDLNATHQAHGWGRTTVPVAKVPPQSAPLCMVDLLGRALVYVESMAAERRIDARTMESRGATHSDAHAIVADAEALAHSIRNALQVCRLSEGETLSPAEAGDVRAVMLDALRTAEKAISFAAGSVPTSTAAHVALLSDRAKVRAAIAAAEAAPSTLTPSALAAFRLLVERIEWAARDRDDNWLAVTAAQARAELDKASAKAAPSSPSPDVLAALREGRDYLRALLDLTPEAAGDALTNNGEDVEDRMTEALARAEAAPSGPAALPPGVCLYLDASTYHLPASDLGLLSSAANDGENLGAIVRPHPHGLWVHVRHDAQEAAEEAARLQAAGLSSALPQVLEHARRLGCDWVNLDSDADEVPGLPTYEHEAPTAPPLTTYQLTLSGFDGTSATDHCVKWVNAPSAQAARRLAERKGWTLQEDPETPFDRVLSKADGVDATADAAGNEVPTP